MITTPENLESDAIFGAPNGRTNSGLNSRDATELTNGKLNSRKANSTRRPPAGFTLLELVLVISIVIVVTAVAAPSIQRTFSRQALQKGADRVRIAMGQARVRAIRTGEEHAVFYSPEGSWFNVAPFANFAEQSRLAGERQELVDEGNYTNFEEDLLPKGVRFAAAQTDVNSRAAAVLSTGESSSGRVGMILFYPYGTSQDAKLLFVNDDQLFVQLQLRGLTGLARTVRVENPEDQ